MTKYREIKQLVHAENIVFWHAVQSCIINIPALFILQKPVLTDFVGLRWITFLCLSATSATLLSNTALQVSLVYITLFIPIPSSLIREWFQWRKASTCLWRLLSSMLVSSTFNFESRESNVVFKVFLERAPRLLEELGAGFIMLSGCLVPLVKFCTRNQ